jgi:uroporphyrinogen-III synthase
MTILRILLTRPSSDAARTAARLTALGHRVLIDSLIAIEPVAIGKPPAGPFAAVAVTSANAVRVAGGMDQLAFLRSLPLYAVGTRTGETASAAGFSNVITADGDAAALARLLASRIKPAARVLYLAGEERARDLAVLLAPAGIAVETVVLYRARPAVEFSAATRAALASASLDAVLHYSPRSAAIFVALAEQKGLETEVIGLRHLCLSVAVAAPLVALGAKVEIAPRPEEAALVDLLQS